MLLPGTLGKAGRLGEAPLPWSQEYSTDVLEVDTGWTYAAACVLGRQEARTSAPIKEKPPCMIPQHHSYHGATCSVASLWAWPAPS